jgi:hypothetical protein
MCGMAPQDERGGMNSITQSPSIALELARMAQADHIGRQPHHTRSRKQPRPPRRRLRLRRPFPWRGRVLPV